MKRFKRISAIFLALALIVGLIPAGILSATASAPASTTDPVVVLHASYTAAQISVNGTMDLADEPVWRRTITLTNGDKVSAAWNAKNLYLAFAGDATPTVTGLAVNGKTEGFTSASGTTAVEYMIPLASVGISQIDYSGTYSLDFTVDGVVWSGVLVFEMSDYALVTLNTPNNGAEKIDNSYSFDSNKMTSTWFAGTFNAADLAADENLTTVLEFDIRPEILPNNGSVVTGSISRYFVKNGVAFTIRDDDTGLANGSTAGDEALLLGLYKNNDVVNFTYYAAGAFHSKPLTNAAEYHIRAEYSYYIPLGATNDTRNDIVSASYYVNGVLIAEVNATSADTAAKCFGPAFSTATANFGQIIVYPQKSNGTDYDELKMTVSNISVTKVNSAATNWLHAAYADMDGNAQMDANAIRQNVTLSSGVKVGAAWDWKNLYVGFNSADHGVTKLTINGQNVSVGSGAEVTVPLADLGINLTSQNIAATYPVSIQIGGYTWYATLALDTSAYSINNCFKDSAAGYGEQISDDNLSAVLNTYEEDNAQKYRDMVWPVDADLASSLDTPTVIELDVTINQMGESKFYPTNYKSGSKDRAFIAGGLSITVIDDVTLNDKKASEAMQTGIYRDGDLLMLVYWDNTAEDYISVVIDTYKEKKQYHLRVEYSYTGNNAGENDVVAAKYFVNGKCVAQSSNAKVFATDKFNVAAANRILLITQDFAMDSSTATAGKSVNVTVANLSISKAQASVLTNKEAAESVDAKIAAIGTVTLSSKDAIEVAEAAYAALTTAQKALVTNYADLTAARATYNELKKEAADRTAAAEVDALINALPGVNDLKLTDKAQVDAARDAYTALGADKAQYVTKLDVLEAAEAKIAQLQAAADKETTDKAAAQVVINQINAIGTVTYSEANAIATVRNAYNTLTDDQKAFVENLEILTNAEAKIAELQAEIDTVEAKIAAIGEVTLSDAEAIAQAKAALEALADDQQTAVENAAVLTAAQATLKALQDAVTAVINKINAIGNVTLESLADIEAAETAYDALTDEQKTLVTNSTVLTEARATYDQLVAEKKAADQAAADAVKALINALGTVTLESKTAIETAEAAYAALTADQKALVTNAADLTAARAAYDQLVAEKEAADKAAADKAAADAVAAQINAIGTVTLESKTAIETAEAAYAALTADQKALVTNAADLTAARAAYNQLVAEKEAADKAAANKAAADAAIAKIESIGTVTLDSKLAIEAARVAYNSLTAEQKAMVSAEILLKLTNAETALKALETPDEPPKTGDNQVILPFVLLIGLSVAGLFVVLTGKKRFF